MLNITENLQNSGIRLRDYKCGNQKTLCPQCSHSRKKKSDPCLSITINHDSAVWNCHNCGWNGGTKEKMTNASKLQPAKILQFTQSVLPEEIILYFAKRGIPKDILRRNKISYGEHYIPAKESKVNCIKFPYYRDGKAVNVKYRTMDKHFVQERGAEKIYYGIDDIKSHDAVIIVEGEIDKLSLEVAGYKNTISVPDGAPKAVKEGVINQEQDSKFSYVWSCWTDFEDKKKIVIAVDNDAPGNALAEELARRYGKDRCYRVRWSLKDANETLVEQGVDNVCYYIENAEPYPVKGLYTASSLMKDALNFYEDGAKPGISTGWSSLNEYMTIRPGELSVVTGIPNSGKSEFVDAMMVNIANNYGWNFAICSFENPSQIHLGKLCEKYLGKSFNSGSYNRMSKDEYAQALTGWAAKHFSFIIASDINDTPTIDWILERAHIAVARYGIKGLVIDPYNEIEHNRPANMTETEYISQLLRKVKKFAQLYGVHVWFIAHPAKPYRSKDGSYPIPSLYDISGSANWVNKADLGVVVHRPEPTNIYAGTEIHIRKVRFKENGKPGLVKLNYDRNSGRYSAI